MTLAHPLYGETIRTGLTTLRVRQVTLALAELMRSRPQFGGEEKLRVARWLLDAGEETPEGLLVEASAVALADGDPQLALTLARRAAAMSGAARASLLVARGHIALGDFVAAAAVLDGLRPPFESRDDAVEYLEAQIAVLRWGLHRYDDLRELLAQAQQWWTDPDWQQQVGLLKLVANGTAPPASALVLTGQLIADPTLDEEMRRRARAVHIGHLFRSGRVREAADFARPLLPRLPLRDIYDEIVCILWPACMIESGDDWDELDRWATKRFAAAIDAGDHSAAARCALPLGGLRMQQGRFADARRWLAEAELELERHNGQGLLLMTRALQVGVALMTGSLGEAGPALDSCRALISDGEPLANERFLLAQAEAWASLAAGDDVQAQETLLAAAGELSDMPPYGVRLSYHAFVWGAPSARVAPHLHEHASRCATRLAAAYVAHVDAHAARDGAALAAAAAELEAIGAIPVAAIAAAQAATAFAREGRDDSARRNAARSQELAARCDGGPRPVLEGVEGFETSKVVLTRRERQLVSLAAQGLTNAEIAQQLVLSVRTVESHLYRAMNKLGVGHRRALPKL